MTTKAFAPANISCLFKIHEDPNPRWMGSFGVGFTLSEGVTVEVTTSQTTQIRFNNRLINFPTVHKVIKSLTKEKVLVTITSPFPLGCGFGLSGASALATAYALNQLLGLKKSNKQLAIIAHIADAESKTGLGDVTNQYYGGVLVKLKPSSQFSVKKLVFNDTPVYVKYFSKLATKSVLTNATFQEGINSAGTTALKKVKTLLKQKKDITFATIIALSKEFVVGSGLLQHKKTMQTIEAIEKRGGHASMIILGNAVFSDILFKGATKVTISDQGAHIMSIY